MKDAGVHRLPAPHRFFGAQPMPLVRELRLGRRQKALFFEERLPVLAAVDNADDRKVVVLDPINDEMRPVGVQPDRRIDLRPLSGDLGMIAENVELLGKPAQIGVGLIR